MAAAPVPNLYDIPVSALQAASLSRLSALLNPPKVLAADNGLPRCWKGLAQLVDVPHDLLPHVSHSDPTGEILKKWTKGSIGLLQEYIGQLDRWDVIYDTKQLMESDAVVYTEKLERASCSAGVLDEDLDSAVLTNDADQEFAAQIIKEMEGTYNLKLCYQERDLVAGHFVHGAIMKLISERCNRLVVVISENFFKSEANKFFCTFAQALGIDQKRRKIIPVMREHCHLPPELNYYFALVYTRSGHLWDFWKKLHDSIESPSAPTRELYSAMITSDSTPEEVVQKPVPVEDMDINPVKFTDVQKTNQNSDSILYSVSDATNITDRQEKNHKYDSNLYPASTENITLKKSTPMSFENLKAKSKKFFGGFHHKVKKSKNADPVAC